MLRATNMANISREGKAARSWHDTPGMPFVSAREEGGTNLVGQIYRLARPRASAPRQSRYLLTPFASIRLQPCSPTSIAANPITEGYSGTSHHRPLSASLRLNSKPYTLHPTPYTHRPLSVSLPWTQQSEMSSPKKMNDLVQELKGRSLMHLIDATLRLNPEP